VKSYETIHKVLNKSRYTLFLRQPMLSLALQGYRTLIQIRMFREGMAMKGNFICSESQGESRIGSPPYLFVSLHCWQNLLVCNNFTVLCTIQMGHDR